MYLLHVRTQYFCDKVTPSKMNFQSKFRTNTRKGKQFLFRDKNFQKKKINNLNSKPSFIPNNWKAKLVRMIFCKNTYGHSNTEMLQQYGDQIKCIEKYSGDVKIVNRKNHQVLNTRNTHNKRNKLVKSRSFSNPNLID